MVQGQVFWKEGGDIFPIYFSRFIIFTFRNYFTLCKIVLCILRKIIFFYHHNLKKATGILLFQISIIYVAWYLPLWLAFIISVDKWLLKCSNKSTRVKRSVHWDCSALQLLLTLNRYFLAYGWIVRWFCLRYWKKSFYVL